MNIDTQLVALFSYESISDRLVSPCAQRWPLVFLPPDLRSEELAVNF